MTATFSLTGDLEPTVSGAPPTPRSAYVELDRPVVDVTNDVTYKLKDRTTVGPEFTLTGLPARDALNNSAAAFNMVVTIGTRKWLVAAQAAGSVHDLTEFPETSGLTPVTPASVLDAQAASVLASASAAAAANSAAQAAAVGSVLATENGDGTVTLTVAGGSAWTVTDNGDGTADVSLAGQSAVLGHSAPPAREVAGGVAGLDAGGKLLVSRMPTTVQLVADVDAKVGTLAQTGGSATRAGMVNAAQGREGTTFNVLDYPGVDSTGAADSTAGLQAVFNTAYFAGAGQVVMPPGTYKTSSGLLCRSAIDARGARINATAGAYTALTVGDVAGLAMFGKHLLLPAVYSIGGTGAFGYGIVASNLNTCEVYVARCEGWLGGLHLLGDDTGNAYNNYHLGVLMQNKVNLALVPGGANNLGYVNENRFIGGRLIGKAWAGVTDTAACNIKLSDSGASQPNGNIFMGVSLEGNITAQYRVQVEGRYNQFNGCRWEAFGGANVVRFGATSSRNIIYGGPYIETITRNDIAGSTAATNKIIEPWL